MTADPKWGEMADALIRVWESMGWRSLLGAAVVLLLWKLLDAWGHRKG